MKSVRVLGALAVVTLTGTIVLGLGLPATYEQRTYSRMLALHPPIAWTAYVAFGVTAAASTALPVAAHACGRAGTRWPPRRPSSACCSPGSRSPPAACGADRRGACGGPGTLG